MKDLKNIMKFVWDFVQPHRGLIFLFILVMLSSSMIGMVNTFLLGNAIDSMLSTATIEAIFFFAAAFLALNLVSFVIGYFAKVGGQRAMEYAVKDCKMQMMQHVEKTSMKYVGNISAGTLMERMNYDTQYLIMFALNTGAGIPENLIVFALALAFIFHIDAICGIAALLELPIIFGLYTVFRKKLLHRSRVLEGARELEYNRLYEMLMDIGHVKKNQIMGLLSERYEEAADGFIHVVSKKVKTTYFYNIINNNMDVFLRVFLFFYGGISVIHGTMTVGEFTIIYSYFSLVTSSCTYFLNLGKEIQSTKANYERLKEITDVPEETNGTEMLQHIEEIRLSNIKFAYKEGEDVLDGFSQTFQKGKLYVVAGENGSGKSTMLSLLLGMYIDDHTGEITYNGRSIKELDMCALRRDKIGVCEQEPFLINDTVRYNMIYSNDATQDEHLMELAYQVSFDEFLKNSEKGLSTLVGEGGGALSGGQKQKTALVKVFYKNPDVMVLDEPTSAMDAEGQGRLIAYLEKIKKKKIIIVITHDQKVIEAADEVVRM